MRFPTAMPSTREARTGSRASVVVLRACGRVLGKLPLGRGRGALEERYGSGLLMIRGQGSGGPLGQRSKGAPVIRNRGSGGPHDTSPACEHTSPPGPFLAVLSMKEGKVLLTNFLSIFALMSLARVKNACGKRKPLGWP